jgi:beta-N-acetylhexosaminidase
MTKIADLVGQSIMLSFVGPDVTPDVLDALAATRAGGVILFAHNIDSPQSLHQLTTTLQTHAASLGLPPLLIAIDQEGGTVSRLPSPFVTVPSAMAQAATNNPAAAYACAHITGRQLRAFGINTNFAPVLDVNCNAANPVINTRSFGQHARDVARYGVAALRGYHESGVIATAKHFPGHGDTNVDSHLGLPVVRHQRERLMAMELAPFIAAFKADVPAIMTAHIIFEALDHDPATLSRFVLTDLLRTELNYEGVIFTDALDMQAIAAQYDPAEAALRAKAAGADVVLPLGTLESQIEVARALTAAVQHGDLPRSCVESTARRLMDLRERYHVTHAVSPLAEPDPRLYEIALKIARRSITCVQGGDQLPLASDTKVALIDCILPRFSLAEDALDRAEYLREIVVQAFPHTECLGLEPHFSAGDLTHARSLAGASDVVVLVTRNACLIDEQAQLLQLLGGLDVPLIHAVVRSPYDAAISPPGAVTLLTYGDPEVSLQALVDVIAGRVSPSGMLPIALHEQEAA